MLETAAQCRRDRVEGGGVVRERRAVACRLVRGASARVRVPRAQSAFEAFEVEICARGRS
jgi:hypothetical protein